MFSNLKGWEWLIIVALILLLFGAKRLPDAARGLGRSMRIFKAETKGLADSDGSTSAVSDPEDPTAPEAKAIKSSELRAQSIESAIADAEER